MSEYVLVFLRLVGVFVNDALTRLRVELARGVPCGDILLGRGIAVAFLRVQVQQFGAFHVLHLTEDAYQFLDVMAVEGTEIADVHALEHVLLMTDGRLEGVIQTYQTMSAVVAHHTAFVEPS